MRKWIEDKRKAAEAEGITAFDGGNTKEELARLMQATGGGAFAVLGESVLDQPNPNLFVEFWLENHPAVGRRAAFGKAYDPWAPGMEPKYFPK